MKISSQSITQLSQQVTDALGALSLPGSGDEAMLSAAAQQMNDLAIRTRKLARASKRPQCVGLFGPSQAGKSFLVGALLSHELSTLEVQCGGRTMDFLKEINPAKGVESTGVVTRFSTGEIEPRPQTGFLCQLLPLEGVLESLATGFLVECTSPSIDAEKIERCLRDARLQAGPAAPQAYRDAWDAVWHSLLKKYQDRHPYLNELKSKAQLRGDAWKKDIASVAGWQLVYSLLWGGPGYAPDLDHVLRLLCQGLEAVRSSELVEVGVEHVRATSDGASVIDAACLNAMGKTNTTVRVRLAPSGAEASIAPGVLAGLIAEIRLQLKRVAGSLLDRADLLDFPGGRALKGINGFGPQELSTGRLDNAIEVYKRGKLTFLFEQFALEREITTLVLCSPGPTKPEAIQMQTQVESWLRIRHGTPTPTTPQEVEKPSLFLALTKFDMSLGVLRSDNAKDRWDSRVQEACVDFWARGASSWFYNWGAKAQAFQNLFWIRNPYADQMQTLKPNDADYETVKGGYMQSRAVARYVQSHEEKWSAVEGTDPGSNLPRSGVPLLASRLRDKLEEDVKSRELVSEAKNIHAELVAALRAITPSKDAAEERERVLASAKALVDAVDAEMRRRASGAVFGELVRLFTADEATLCDEVRRTYQQVAPMSIKTSDKVKRVLVAVLKWWTLEATRRFRESDLGLPQAAIDQLIREVCTSKQLLPVLGQTVYPYFTRQQVDCDLIARILQVRLSDGLLELCNAADRQTPQAPLRLSYSEVATTDGSPGDAIDWTNVDFDAEEQPLGNVEIIFAGQRRWKHFARNLGDFYLKNRGGVQAAAPEEPRTQRLTVLLREVERTHVSTEG